MASFSPPTDRAARRHANRRNRSISLLHLLLPALGLLATGCETGPQQAAAPTTPSINDTKILALQQERSQLLETLGEFHDRIRELEAKLGDQDNRPAAASYDQLLSKKDAELTELRQAAAERDRLAGQITVSANELQQARQRVAALEHQAAGREKDLAALHQHSAVVAELDTARRRITELDATVARQDGDLRATRAGKAERDSLVAQLESAGATITTLKLRLTTLDQQLQERDKAFDTTKAKLAEREKLIPQYNAMVAEVYQSRHRVATLEQQLAEKGRDPTVNARAKGLPERPVPGNQPSAAQTEAKTGRFMAMRNELMKVLPGDRGPQSITVTQDGTRLTIALAASWAFGTSDVGLTPDGTALLKRIGTVLAQGADRFVQVTGHTDNQPVSKSLQKTFPDNKAFSWARAEAARRALINGGIPAERTKAVGLADSRPLASNATDQGRQRNRRLELLIVQSPTVAAKEAAPADQALLLSASHPVR